MQGTTTLRVQSLRHFYTHNVNINYIYALLLTELYLQAKTVSRREGLHPLHLTCLVGAPLDPSQLLLVLVSRPPVRLSDEQSSSCPGSSSVCKILLFPVHPAQ